VKAASDSPRSPSGFGIVRVGVALGRWVARFTTSEPRERFRREAGATLGGINYSSGADRRAEGHSPERSPRAAA